MDKPQLTEGQFERMYYVCVGYSQDEAKKRAKELGYIKKTKLEEMEDDFQKLQRPLQIGKETFLFKYIDALKDELKRREESENLREKRL